jgi:flagellar biosynthesis/type III secretory pathway chaperone
VSPIDPALCRSQLAGLLNEEASSLALLETQLQREHAMLTNNDVDGLEAAGNERQACVGRLLRIEDERQALCRQFGRPTDYRGVESLLQWCDPTASLLDTLQSCTDLATRCRDQNLRNGALVNARLQRVSNLLGMMDSSGSTSRTYGRFGTNTAAPPPNGLSFNASA